MARRRNRQARNVAYANKVSNARVTRFSMPRVVSTRDSTVVSGSELFGYVSCSSTPTMAYVSLDLGIQSNTWVGRMATNYNKYKFQRATLRFVPFVPTSTPGRLIIGWVGDPTQQPTTATAIWASQFANAVETPVWTPIQCNFVNSRTPEYTFTTVDSTELMNEGPGQFGIYTDYGPGSSLACGSLYLDYTVMLSERSAFAGN